MAAGDLRDASAYVHDGPLRHGRDGVSRPLSLHDHGPPGSELPHRDGARLRTGDHLRTGWRPRRFWRKRDADLEQPKNPQNLLPVDPFKTLQSLSGTLAPRDLGDTTIAGVRAHHYAMEMDPAKLVAEETSALAEPSLRPALQDAIQKGTFHVEVWIGVEDHLLRRISTDGARKETIALHNVETNSALPPGASDQGIVAISDEIVLNFHGFNGPVTITPPAVR